MKFGVIVFDQKAEGLERRGRRKEKQRGREKGGEGNTAL